MTEEYSQGRQAIVTKYLGPTNSRGSRVKATASAGSITLAWNDALNQDDNHLAAALFLQHKFNWTGRLFCGGLPNSGDRVYVLIEFEQLHADILHECNENSDGRPASPVKIRKLLLRVLHAIR